MIQSVCRPSEVKIQQYNLMLFFPKEKTRGVSEETKPISQIAYGHLQKMEGRPRARDAEVVWAHVEDIGKKAAQACEICSGQFAQGLLKGTFRVKVA